MKKTFLALMLCFVCILMYSCGGNGSNNSTNTQNVNIKVSEGTSQWECIGTVTEYAPKGGWALQRDLNDKYGYIYAKQVAGEVYYLMKGWDFETQITKNPNYGSSKYGEYGTYRYCFCYKGKTFYINF